MTQRRERRSSARSRELRHRATAGVAASGQATAATSARRLPGLHLPRLSGVLGGAVESDQPWKFLNALLLTLLVGANLVLVAVRSRIARLQSR